VRPFRRLLLLVAVAVGLVAPASPAGAAPALPASMASVGDSITRGYDAVLWGCFLADCPQYSWASGTSTSVNSHFRQLRAQGATTLTAANYARTGAKVSELATQMTRAASAQYVTVLIGANDLCTSTADTMTSEADFRSRFTAGLAAYFSGKSPAEGRVFVSSIPDLNKLRLLGQTIPGAVNTWTSFRICQSILNPKATTEQITRVQQREAAFNLILQQECAKYAGRCLYDGGATFSTSFVRSDLSTVDYFHPSVAGQNKLGTVTWDAGWWRPGA
jgi:lysophospholipase L1-like esterase